jgi:hypothetical protein
MKRKNLWAMGISLVVVLTMAGTLVFNAFADSVDTTYIKDDFETGIPSGWSDLSKDRGQASVQTDTDGNRYMQITYNEAGTDIHQYYDMKRAQATITTVAQADFDIRFSEVDTVRNGHIQMKNRTGSGASQSKHASRLLKNYNRLQYIEGGKAYNLSTQTGEDLLIEAHKWYTVKMIANLEEGWQSIYVRDRDTELLLGKVERIPMCEETTEINMVTFMGNTTMDLDNVRMTKIVLRDGYITGNPYPKKNGSSDTAYPYQAYGTSTGGLATYNLTDMTWSLEQETEGVTVDPQTGVLTISKSVPVTTVVLQAVNSTGTIKYLVDIEQ